MNTLLNNVSYQARFLQSTQFFVLTKWPLIFAPLRQMRRGPFTSNNFPEIRCQITSLLKWKRRTYFWGSNTWLSKIWLSVNLWCLYLDALAPPSRMSKCLRSTTMRLWSECLSSNPVACRNLALAWSHACTWQRRKIMDDMKLATIGMCLGWPIFFTKLLGKIWGHVGEIFEMLEDCWANLANNGDTLGRCWELGQDLIGWSNWK